MFGLLNFIYFWFGNFRKGFIFVNFVSSHNLYSIVYTLIYLPINVPCHSKIPNLCHSAAFLGRQQHIPCGDISVYEMLHFQVFAPVRYIDGYLQQVSHLQWRRLTLEGLEKENNIIQ